MLGTREPPPSRATWILGVYGGLTLLAILVSAGRGDADIIRLDESRAPWWYAASVAIGLLLALLIVATTRWVARFSWGQALQRDFRSLLGDASGREILILAGASAIGEELLFRGALVPWIGVVPQAVLFALLHVGPRRRHLLWTGWAFAMGAVLGIMAVVMGDVLGAVVAHFAINFANLHYIVRGPTPAPAFSAP
jgi:uncharacterized protein